MFAKSALMTTVFCLIAATALSAQDKKPSVTEKEFVYKKIDDVELKLFVHLPEGWKESDKRPAIVFFFGGGWANGTPKQFEPQAAYLAGRGMVTARADYRVKNRQNVAPDKCVEDAKSAIRWMRQNAGKLGINPERLAAGGGSAGGHLAIAAFTTKGLEAKGEDEKISSKPNLLILYNPAMISAAEMRKRVDSDEVAKQISILANLSADLPPAIIFFGTKDRLIEGAQEYVKRAKDRDLGYQVELYTADDQPHGFFNKPPWLDRTIHQTDLFLAKHGYLKGEPTIKPSADATLKLAGKNP